MKIRKKILSEIRGCNKKAMLTKALSMVLFFQIKVSKEQERFRKEGITCFKIDKFSYNKIRLVTGLHISTIKKRLKVAKEQGWVRTENGNLIIDKKALRSSHIRNNYSLKNDFDKIIELQDTLLSYIIVSIQEAKEFVKGVFDKLNSPKNLKEYKKARRFVQEKYPNKTSFEDKGISYKCLMMNTGIKKTKLSKLIGFAEKKNIFKRQRNTILVDEEETPYLLFLERKHILDDFLFSKFGRLVHYFFTYRGLYICRANSYEICWQ